jgi:hypothetical protein
MKHSRIPRFVRIVSLLLTVFAMTVTSSAQASSAKKVSKGNKPAATQKVKPAETYSTEAGQRIYVDPVTKQTVQPTAEDVKALNSAGATTLKTAAKPQVFITPEGVHGMALGEESMAYAVVTKGPDGKLTFGCVDGKSKADAIANSGKLEQQKQEVLDDK